MNWHFKLVVIVGTLAIVILLGLVAMYGKGINRGMIVQPPQAVRIVHSIECTPKEESYFPPGEVYLMSDMM
jgi:hypothetical protein